MTEDCDWPEDCDEPPDDDEDDGSECAGRINGKFSYYDCTQAGTEYCDWECPNGASARLRARKEPKT